MFFRVKKVKSFLFKLVRLKCWGGGGQLWGKEKGLPRAFIRNAEENVDHSSRLKF